MVLAALALLHCVASLPVIEVLPVVTEDRTEDDTSAIKNHRPLNVHRDSRYDVRYTDPHHERYLTRGPAVRYDGQRVNYRNRAALRHYERRPFRLWNFILRPFRA